jgi:hypothetical protein
MVAGLFSDANRAERAYQGLFARGYRHDEVIVAMPEAVWQALFAATNATAHGPTSDNDTDSRAPEEAEATSGHPVPTAVSISSNGFATRVMAAGRTVNMLADAIRKPVSDGLPGALAVCGIQERMTRDCAVGVQEGKILLGVLPATLLTHCRSPRSGCARRARS